MPQEYIENERAETIVIIIDNYRQEPHPGVGPVYDDLSRITEHK